MKDAITLYHKANKFERENGHILDLNWPTQFIATLNYVITRHNNIEIALTNAFNVLQNKLGKSQVVIGSLRSLPNLSNTLKNLLANEKTISEMSDANKITKIHLKAPLQLTKTYEFSIKVLDLITNSVFEMYDSIEKCTSKFDKDYKINNTYKWIDTLVLHIRQTRSLISTPQTVQLNLPFLTQDFISKFYKEKLEKLKIMNFHIVETYGDVLGLVIVKSAPKKLSEEEDTNDVEYTHLKLNNSNSFNSLTIDSSNKNLSNSLNLNNYSKNGNISEENKNKFPLHYHSSFPFGFKEIEKIFENEKNNPNFGKEQKINQLDNKNMTPLFTALLSNNEKNVSFLLDNGANVNLQDQIGNTILHLSILKNFQTITSLLLNHKNFTSQFDINIKNNKNETVFHLLARNQNISSIKKLVEVFKNSDLFIVDQYNRNALELLTFKSNLSFFEPKTSSDRPLDFSSYLNKCALSDVVFSFHENSQKISFYGHRIILCAQSGPFKQLLESQKWSENSQNEIFLKDVDSQSFYYLLSALYKGFSELGSLKYNEDSLLSVLKLSDRFLIHFLKEDCAYFLSERITLENCYWMFLSLVNMEGLFSLKTKCATFILNNYHTIQNDEDHSVILSVLGYLQTRF